MKIVGAVGRIGSGKDELVRHLERQAGAQLYSLGDMVRRAAAAEGVKPTRQQLQEIADKYIRQEGQDYFIRTLADRLERENPPVAAITGIRSPADVRVLKERYGENVLIVHVSTDFGIRFKRNRERGESRDPERREEFEEQNRREEELFHLDRTIEMADISLDNNGTLEEFHRQIKERIIPWLI